MSTTHHAHASKIDAIVAALVNSGISRDVALSATLARFKPENHSDHIDREMSAINERSMRRPEQATHFYASNAADAEADAAREAPPPGKPRVPLAVLLSHFPDAKNIVVIDDHGLLVDCADPRAMVFVGIGDQVDVYKRRADLVLEVNATGSFTVLKDINPTKAAMTIDIAVDVSKALAEVQRLRIAELEAAVSRLVPERDQFARAIRHLGWDGAAEPLAWAQAFDHAVKVMGERKDALNTELTAAKTDRAVFEEESSWFGQRWGKVCEVLDIDPTGPAPQHLDAMMLSPVLRRVLEGRDEAVGNLARRLIEAESAAKRDRLAAEQLVTAVAALGWKPSLETVQAWAAGLAVDIEEYRRVWNEAHANKSDVGGKLRRALGLANTDTRTIVEMVDMLAATVKPRRKPAGHFAPGERALVFGVPATRTDDAMQVGSTPVAWVQDGRMFWLLASDMLECVDA